MAISTFNVREEYIGTGSLDTYTFDFKLASLAHLIVLVTSDVFVETFRVDGNDTTYLTSVTFDSDAGGGEIVLADVLPSGHHLTILLANDQPLQESEFKDKSDFTLKRFEAALDVQARAIQRLAYLSARSLKLSDNIVDAETFDPTIPFNTTDSGVEDNTNKVICVGPDNASFIVGPSVVDLAAEAAAALASQNAAAASAAAALVSEGNASTSATNAAASAAAALISEGNALASELSAADSANNASNSEINAAASAAAALVSEGNASSSKDAAALSAAAALTSEGNASTSATNASNSATLAGTRATNALNSQTAAATSASNAAASETNAGLSASAAAQSAIDAAAAAAAAPTTYGTEAAPVSVNAAVGITSGASQMSTTAIDQIIFVKGTILGDNDLSGLGTQITAHTVLGARMTIVGSDNTHPIILGNGNGLKIRGNWRSDDDNLIKLFWNGTVWREESRVA